jgi:hypothetical protein
MALGDRRAAQITLPAEARHKLKVKEADYLGAEVAPSCSSP